MGSWRVKYSSAKQNHLFMHDYRLFHVVYMYVSTCCHVLHVGRHKAASCVIVGVETHNLLHLLANDAYIHVQLRHVAHIETKGKRQ